MALSGYFYCDVKLSGFSELCFHLWLTHKALKQALSGLGSFYRIAY